MRRPRILCAGCYESLQLARSLVLQQAGFETEAVTSPEAAVSAARGQFDLAVICDSFSPFDAERLARDLRTVSPGIRIILLGQVCCADSPQDSPEVLIALVRSTLETPAVTPLVTSVKSRTA